MKFQHVLIALSLVSANVFGQGDVTVETDFVTREQLASTMPASGVVVSREDASIASELEGRLVWIAEAGDRFSRGETIARLDTHLIELRKRDREALIAGLEANLDWLKRQTERLDKLADKNNTAHSERDETRARYLVLQNELAQAEVELERTHYDLQRAEIKAPFDGVVVSRDMAAGEFATVGRPLLRLVNTDAAEISVTAPLRLARYTRAGDKVTLRNQDNTDTAEVRSLISVGDLRSHMMELRVTPGGDNWLIGEAVTVELPASQQRLQTTVARDAVVLRDHSNYVYVVQQDNTAQRVIVELGEGLGERIAVSGQLQAGDRVIVRGAERLRDGQKVSPIEQRLSMR
jgi:RND family efflux transporter MFP subunit